MSKPAKVFSTRCLALAIFLFVGVSQLWASVTPKTRPHLTPAVVHSITHDLPLVCFLLPDTQGAAISELCKARDEMADADSFTFQQDAAKLAPPELTASPPPSPSMRIGTRNERSTVFLSKEVEVPPP